METDAGSVLTGRVMALPENEFLGGKDLRGVGEIGGPEKAKHRFIDDAPLINLGTNMPSEYVVVPTSRVKICETLGAVRLAKPEQDGAPQTETLFYVADPAQLTEGPKGPVECVDALLGGSSETPVLVFCFIVKGTACYLMVDPLDPAIRPALEHARASQEFILVTQFGEFHDSTAVRGKVFADFWASLEGKKHAGRPKWLERAMASAEALPAAFAMQMSCLREISDHRVVFTLPYEELKSMCGA